MTKKPSRKLLNKLPKKFRGAEVVRGLGMNSAKLDGLVERKSLDGFNAFHDMYIVVDDRCLDDAYNTADIKAFKNRDAAIRYARALGNGNVDQRVLRVTEQVLVVATDNDL